MSDRDFINEAFEIIAESGSYDGLTIDNLCTRLNVSKGSFYWHFKGRAGLIEAVVGAWSGRLHENIYSDIDAQTGGEPELGIAQVIEVWSNSNISRIDRVMRNLACKDENVQQAVAQADQLLLGFLKSKLIGIGLASDEAQRWARLLIAIGIAQPQLAHLPMPGTELEERLWMFETLMPKSLRDALIR
ncbi:TetR/AcrR family transcriptional regulator [Spongiibacter sp. KMU-158]|uniref:TetR/AcrR family transcriptional regulator n=1 Tax=Spongiibacter pelagi TaxID=2760804 RepID=A0A927GVN7_9GAMM|nr:TetR/AcrR family transcriptional regulator [Spongiibacter pelagi]MBD2858077.1 TetR/AcrR family transcriptional regulator [Spongiibacter pelagi]